MKIFKQTKKNIFIVENEQFQINNSVPKNIIQSADNIVKNKPPIGFVKNEHPVPINTPIWAYFDDANDKNCFIVLKKHVDGTGVFIRVEKRLTNVNKNAD